MERDRRPVYLYSAEQSANRSSLDYLDTERLFFQYDNPYDAAWLAIQERSSVSDGIAVSGLPDVVQSRLAEAVALIASVAFNE